MRHSDQFSESIARGCLRGTTIARQQWSCTSEHRAVGKRKLRTPFIKWGGQQVLRIRLQLVTYSVRECRAVKDRDPGEWGDDDFPPSRPVSISLSALARDFAVSRAHLRQLVRDGVTTAEEAVRVSRQDAASEADGA